MCTMVSDLKEQEGVHRVRCLRIGRDKPDPRAAIRFREVIANVFLEPCHGRDARRVGVVNEHRRLEISGGKHLGDVSEVHPNLIDTRFILGVIGRDGDFSAIVE